MKVGGGNEDREEPNLLLNDDENDLYSPKQKCLNYLDTNIFPSSLSTAAFPTQSVSLPSTPMSSQAKKSLLAKAIKNNMAASNNNFANLMLNNERASMDDLSMLSNNCSSSVCGGGEGGGNDEDESTTTHGGGDDDDDYNGGDDAGSSDMSLTPGSSPLRRKKVEFNEDSQMSMELSYMETETSKF